MAPPEFVSTTPCPLHEVESMNNNIPYRVAQVIGASGEAEGPPLGRREPGAAAVVPAVPSDAERNAMGRLVLEASTGMHGDVAKTLAIELCTALDAVKIAALSQTKQPQAEAGDERPPNFWQGMDPWMVEFIGRGVGLVKVLYNEPHDAIDRSRTGDWIQTAIEVFKKAQAHGVATPPAATPAAPGEVTELAAMLARYIEHYDAKPSITYIRLTRDEADRLRAALAQPAPVAAPAKPLGYVDALALRLFVGSASDHTITLRHEPKAGDCAIYGAAPAPASEAVEKWIFDPHDIEQGMMLNPAWLKLHGLTAQESIQTTRPRAGAGKEQA